jgi:hypothetical protein
MAVLVADLIADIRTMSGLRNNQLFLDSDIVDMTNDAVSELYDDVEGSFQAYFVSNFDFTIASGSNSIALPANFKRDNSLTYNPTSQSPSPVKPLGSWLERGGASTSGMAGNYRLYYTPMASLLVLPDTTRAYSISTGSYTASTRTLVATGGVSPAFNATTDIGAAILIQSNNQLLAGTYVIASVVSATTAVLVSGPAADIPSIPSAGGSIYTGFSGSPVLPQSLGPWAVYLKVHVAITIRTSRQQDTTTLDQKLQALKQRVAGSAKNRTQSPRQAPITRRRAFNGYDSIDTARRYWLNGSNLELYGFGTLGGNW